MKKTAICNTGKIYKNPKSRGASSLIYAGFLLGFLFYPEDGGKIKLRNAGLFWNKLERRRPYSSY
jgi:hypothetical protein